MSTKGSRAVIALCLALLVLAAEVSGDVVTTYDEFSTIRVVQQPLTPWWPIPCPCAGGFSSSPTGLTRSIYGYTLQTTVGYQLTSLLSAFNTTSAGNLSVGFNSFPYSLSSASVAAYSGATANGAQIGSASSLKRYGSIKLETGTYAVNQALVFSSPINSPTSVNGAYNYSIGGVTFSYNLTESIKPLTGNNIVNLMNGYTVYPPYVYQGDNDGSRTSAYPVYQSAQSAATHYWPSGSGVDQPVLDMVPPQTYSAGALFWSEPYTAGNTATITVVGTYASNSAAAEDGFEVYMFIIPTTGAPSWSVSSASNWNIPYAASLPPGHPKSSPSSQVVVASNYAPYQGDVILPTSTQSYLMVQWDPYWQVVGPSSKYTGQFNIWIVSNQNNVLQGQGQGTPLSVTAYNGQGTGYFEPSPGDYVCLTVTYYPSNNSISACAVDLNTGQFARVSISLSGSSSPSFAKPSGTSYAFGVAGNTGSGYANWAVVYTNYSSS